MRLSNKKNSLKFPLVLTLMYCFCFSFLIASPTIDDISKVYSIAAENSNHQDKNSSHQQTSDEDLPDEESEKNLEKELEDSETERINITALSNRNNGQIISKLFQPRYSENLLELAHIVITPPPNV